MNACMRDGRHHYWTRNPVVPVRTTPIVSTEFPCRGPREGPITPAPAMAKEYIYQIHFEPLFPSSSIYAPSPYPPHAYRPRPHEEPPVRHRLARRKSGSVTRHCPFPRRASSSSTQLGILPPHPPLHHVTLHRGSRRHREDCDVLFRGAFSRPGAHASL